MRRWALAGFPLLALLGGLGLGEAAWGLSQQGPDFVWPALDRSSFWAWGAGLGLLWTAGNLAAAWMLGLSAAGRDGFQAACAGLLPGLLAPAWRLALRVPIPPPHDLAFRKVEIFFAGLLILGLTLSLAVHLWCLSRDRAWLQRPARSQALRLGGLALGVYFLCGLWTGTWLMTGDAPVYLLMTHSLLHDHDLDLSNNYARRDWAAFYDRELLPQDPPLADGKMISEHKPLWPLLLLPGYRLAGLSGALAVAALIAALAGSLVFLLARHWGHPPAQALACWALFAFCSPWWAGSQSLMTEECGGLLLLLPTLALAGLIPDFWALVAVAAMPWLGLRFYAPGLLLALALAWRQRRRGLPAFWPPLAWALSLLAGLALNYSQYGGASPIAGYQHKSMAMQSLFDLSRLPHNLGALLLDQEYGWLFYAPFFMLALPGLRSLWVRRRAWVLAVAPGLLAYAGLLLGIPWWHGDMAPARYLVATTPFWALASFEAYQSGRYRVLGRVLLGFQMAWSWLLVALPWFCFSKQNGINRLLGILGLLVHQDLSRFFPSFNVAKGPNFVWALAAGLLAVYLWRRQASGPVRPS